MKKILDKINGMSKRNKIILGICSIFVIGAIIVGLGASYSSTESGYLTDQTVSGLSFENAELSINNGVSTYTVDVTNDLEEVYSLKTINIVFKDSSGNETVLLGYIGDKLSVSETKIMEASIDIELTDIVSIEYRINK